MGGQAGQIVARNPRKPDLLALVRRETREVSELEPRRWAELSPASNVEPSNIRPDPAAAPLAGALVRSARSA